MVLSIPGPATGALALAVLLGAAACGGDAEKAAASRPTAAPTYAQTSPGLGPTDGLTAALPSGADRGVPSDFPSDEVPLLAGAVTQPLGAGSGPEGKKGWVLELQLASRSEACFDAAAAALTGHGFTQQPGEINDQGNRQAQFTAPGYAVIVSSSPTDSGGCRLGYEVGQIPTEPGQ